MVNEVRVLVHVTDKEQVFRAVNGLRLVIMATVPQVIPVGIDFNGAEKIRAVGVQEQPDAQFLMQQYQRFR